MVLLDGGEEQSLLGDLYLLELTRGLQEALVASGYGPVLNTTRDTLHQFVAAHAVDGVILTAGIERPLLAREIAGRGTPCVVVTQPPTEEIPGVGWVDLDLEPGARAAARLLLDQGHRRIGFIGNFEGDVVRDAFAAELADSGAPLQPELTVLAGRGREAGAAAMHRLLELPERPTVVFARTDVMAAGALQAARSRGLRVPAQLSLVGHDDIPLAERLGLTTVRIDCDELGRAAAGVLFSLLNDGAAPATVPTVRTRVVMRRTVGPAPQG